MAGGATTAEAWAYLMLTALKMVINERRCYFASIMFPVSTNPVINFFVSLPSSKKTLFRQFARVTGLGPENQGDVLIPVLPVDSPRVNFPESIEDSRLVSMGEILFSASDAAAAIQSQIKDKQKLVSKINSAKECPT